MLSTPAAATNFKNGRVLHLIIQPVLSSFFKLSRSKYYDTHRTMVALYWYCTTMHMYCTSAQIAQHHQRKGKKAGRIPPFIDDLLHSLKRQNGATTIELGTVWVTSHLFQYSITNQRTHSSIPASSKWEYNAPSFGMDDE